MARLNARQFIRPETSPSLSLADAKNVAKIPIKNLSSQKKKFRNFQYSVKGLDKADLENFR